MFNLRIFVSLLVILLIAVFNTSDAQSCGRRARNPYCPNGLVCQSGNCVDGSYRGSRCQRSGCSGTIENEDGGIFGNFGNDNGDGGTFGNFGNNNGDGINFNNYGIGFYDIDTPFNSENDDYEPELGFFNN